MSEVEHTPGPWGSHPFSNPESGLEVTSDNGQEWTWWKLCVGSGQTIVATCEANTEIKNEGYPFPRTYDEAEANARLIAAAPELLEALQAIIQRENDFNRWGQGTLIGDSVADDARRAIAKATGKEPA